MAAAVRNKTLSTKTHPLQHLALVTPHDTNELAHESRAVLVGTEGALAVVTSGGEAITTPALAAGVFHPLEVKQIKATGTTAQNIMIGW